MIDLVLAFIGRCGEGQLSGDWAAWSTTKSVENRFVSSSVSTRQLADPAVRPLLMGRRQLLTSMYQLKTVLAVANVLTVSSLFPVSFVSLRIF